VAALTWIGQEAAGALLMMQQIPVSVRIVKSAEWLWRYIGSTFWPEPLVLPYPYDSSVGGAAAVYWVAALLVTATVIALRRPYPYLGAGWLWFVVALLPSLGFVQAGGQSMADRFTDLPHIGFLAALVWVAADVLHKRAASISAAVAISAAAGTYVRRTAFWRDSVTLLRHTVNSTPANWVARAKLGSGLLDKGAFTDAEVQLREAVRQQPARFPAITTWAVRLSRREITRRPLLRFKVRSV
jgi:protein O-mannosyl-transferase